MVQPCLADNDGGQIRGAVVRARGSHPGVQHQRPPTHAEDHPVLLNHEGGTQHHRRRYLLLLFLTSPPPAVLPVCFYLTFIWQQRAERECTGITVLWHLSLISVENGDDDTLRGLKSERRTGGKGEGLIWIWVKCGGNSRWPVKDDVRRGCVGLGLAKKETSVSGVLLYIVLHRREKDSIQKSERRKIFLFVKTC